jgi:adenylate kinase family enzyme
MAAGQAEFVAFSPGIQLEDALANYWIQQGVLRLRRELCWLWRASPRDTLSESLNETRHWHEKQEFFSSDVTARYLSELIAAPAPRFESRSRRGSFSWIVRELGLDDLACLAMGLVLSAGLDSAAGVIIGSCLNQPATIWPTLALMQKLWVHPGAVLDLADPGHPLLRYSLIHIPDSFLPSDWNAPWMISPVVARELATNCANVPACLEPLDAPAASLSPEAHATAIRLRQSVAHLRIIPLIAEGGADGGEIAAGIAEAAGRVAYQPAPGVRVDAHVAALATVCWMRDADLFVRIPTEPAARSRFEGALPQVEGLPICIYAASDSAGPLHVPRHILLPPVSAGAITWADRVACWTENLGPSARGLEDGIRETARRFRGGRAAIASAARTLLAMGGPIGPAELAIACRAQTRLDVGELAQPVAPRFADEELFLPEKQTLQFQEVLRAMQSLTEVHYVWGTARVWNEGGITALFAGPPGTGKTMAAEVLAHRLDLPIYRVDLSQVVNKYIGETEKNLKRLFDAADISDCILFFDEADSLFGRRTETRDAHDRYANLEIGYLLDRMERFKGLAILATNRKKDLDEAFLRRLRYVIEFPLPSLDQRLQIWSQSIPAAVGREAVDLDFLARSFPLAGGHIRSIVFNACLQAAHRRAGARLGMEDIMIAVKREYDKLHRPLTLEQAGAYSALIERIDGEARDPQY